MARIKIERPLLLLVCLACGGVVSVVLIRRDGAAAVEPLRSIQANEIDNIKLYDESLRNVVANVNDADAIRDFAQSCRDVEYFAPGSSNTRTQDINITVQTERKLELRCWYDQRVPDEVFGYIVRTSESPEGGRYQKTVGRFKSKRLRSWIDVNLRPD